MERESIDRGERETNVKQTELFWRERQLLRDKVKALLSGEYYEPRTAWLGVRLQPTIYELYKRAPDDIKRAARRALEAVVISWFMGRERIEDRRDAKPAVFNVNININENQARAEVKVRIPERLAKALEELEEFLDFIAYKSYNAYPRPVKQKAARGLDALRELKRIVGGSN